jgi:hypothetical protein
MSMSDSIVTGGRRLTPVAATGQSRCWDEAGTPVACAGTGQDGELRRGRRWPGPRFVTADDGVLDRLTGLIWLSDANHVGWPLDWSEALDAVAELRRSGRFAAEDWRLPDRHELWSLVSFADCNPALPSGHPFENVVSGWYWSATTAARNSAYAWAVQMTGGRVFFEAKDRYALVWPCRAASDAIAVTIRRSAFRFEPDDDVVHDRLTGLVWRRDADLSGGASSWSGALETVRRLDCGRTGGYRWRLPSITELESLLDDGRCDPSLPEGHPFRGVRVGDGYWSSTSSVVDPEWAMVLHLGRGAVGVGIKRDPRCRAWPVRDP